MMPPRRALNRAVALDPALTKNRWVNGKGRHIYFIQGHARGLIKIGSANDPWQRFKDIQACCPTRLFLIGVVWDGGVVGERFLHEDFAAFRRHGEWFEPASELLAYIAEHATDACQPPEVSQEQTA